MRRLILAVSVCLLASLPILAQKTKPAPPLPPPTAPVTITLPAQSAVDSVFGDKEGSSSPLFFGNDGNEFAYTGGPSGITTTFTMNTTKDGVTSTTIELQVTQAAGLKIGVQGLNYLTGSGKYSSIVPDGMDYCRFSLWDALGKALTREPGLIQAGCVLDFLGSVTSGPHMHPPAPYDRFLMRVRVPTHLTSMLPGDEWRGSSTSTAALSFGDFHNPYGVCAESDWSDPTGGADLAQQDYVVRRGQGNTWEIAVWKANHLLNEAYAVITTGRRAGCRSYLPWSESSQAIRYWFTVSY